ncbi:MAG: hypothetical protein AABZ31_08205, partial [Bdellovibrionota bacterium]
MSTQAKKVSFIQGVVFEKKPAAPVSSKSLWSDAWRRLKKNKMAVFSFYFVIAVCLISVFAEMIATHPFDEQNMDRILESSSTDHWLGTDDLGRDLYSRLVFGARMSMSVGIFTAIISLVLGTIYGSIAGWIRRARQAKTS